MPHSYPLDLEQERRWAAHREACLERWLDAEAARIAALPSLDARREALGVYTREAFAQRIKTRIARLFEQRATAA